MQKELFKRNPLLNITLDFAWMNVRYTKTLEVEKNYVVAGQSLRRQTSVGTNSVEAQQAASKADSIQKIQIAAIAADETEYRLTPDSCCSAYPGCKPLEKAVKEIQK